MVLYMPAAKQCSNNILQRELRSSKGFAGTHFEICCIHSFGDRGLRLYPLGAMLCSNNIIRYHRRSSKGFAVTQLEIRSFEVRSLVLYRPAAKHCSNNILQREHRSSKGFAEHMSRSAASTALEPEVCGCIH